MGWIHETGQTELLGPPRSGWCGDQSFLKYNGLSSLVPLFFVFFFFANVEDVDLTFIWCQVPAGIAFV